MTREQEEEPPAAQQEARSSLAGMLDTLWAALREGDPLRAEIEAARCLLVHTSSSSTRTI